MQTRERVLIVEDEYFLAQDLAVALQSRGAKIVALVGELGEALEQLAGGGFDVAVVDINLKGEFAYRIADELQRLRIPFVLATGYSANVIPSRFDDVIRSEKPYRPCETADLVVRLCHRPARIGRR